MGTISIPNVRISSDCTLKIRLKDGGIFVDWGVMTDVRAYIYSDAQKSMAGRCSVSVDADDHALLICEYAATKPQYLGVNRIVVQGRYHARTKTYDKAVLNFVSRTADVDADDMVLDDPVLDIEIDVQDVTSSILDTVIAACVKATDEAKEVVDIQRGPEGLSAYEVAVEQGFQGDEDEWLESLKGERGEQGIQGARGPAGVEGAVVVVDDETDEQPSAVATVDDGILYISIHGIKGKKGDQGNSGYQGAAEELEIVNNDTEGGEEAGWSAERGKVMRTDVNAIGAKTNLMYPNVIDDTAVNVAEQPLYNYQINSSNKYTTNSSYKHIRIAVAPGQKVLVKAAAGHSAQMAWLRNNNEPSSGGTPAFVAGTVRFDLAAGGQEMYVVPEGAVRLYIYAGASPYEFLPAAVNITSSKVHGVVDTLDSTSSFDALAAAKGPVLEKGYSEVPQEVTAHTKMMISSDTANIVSNNNSTYVVYSVPVVEGDVLRIKASDEAAHTIRYGFAQVVEAGYLAWNYVDLTVDSLDVVVTAPFGGYFVIYHISTYFSDMSIVKRVPTTDGAVSQLNNTVLDAIAGLIGAKDYKRVIPAWQYGKFQYYNQNTTANSSSMARTRQVPTNGKKWIYFTQYVTTGNGTAGIRFFDANDAGVMGFRQVIDADDFGLRRVLLEVPAGASYFIASCSISKIDGWFAYLFDDDRLAELIRTADNRKHIKVCLLGNSYTADAWRYVPTMLLKYGITMESFFYYRGSGSLYDLDTQWTDTSPTGTSDLDGGEHARITFYVNSENNPVWVQWGTVLSAADIVGRRKWDIISLQQGGNRCKDIDTYYPSLQNIIDKIAAICDYPYSLWWYMAYNGSSQNAVEGANQESLDTQKQIIKIFPFANFFPTAAAVFNAQGNETLAALGGSEYKHMYASDNVHMQEGVPCYVAACSVVQRLLDVFRPGMSVLQDQFRATAENIADLGMTQTANGSSTGVTDDNCFLAQKAALVADRSPFEIIQI